MNEPCPSAMAWRVALRRAAHQLLDAPLIFADPLALRMVGAEGAVIPEPGAGWLDQSPLARVLRGSLAARSRFAEDSLALARSRGSRQYVILGAGLDTFAYRALTPEADLRVFEVDRPAIQDWKRRRLTEMGLEIPAGLCFAPVDFEQQALAEGLARAGFDSSAPTFFSWLGVSMYLSRPAIETTLAMVADLPEQSGIVFDYMLDPEMLSTEARRFYDGLAHRVARAGEPFQSCFVPEDLATLLRGLGFNLIDDHSPQQLDDQYFQGRSDGLRMGRLARLLVAWV